MIFVGFTQKTYRTAHDAKTASGIPDCDRFAAERLDLCHGQLLLVAVVNVDRNLSKHTHQHALAPFLATAELL
jgi:hypothetical protein